MNNLLQDFEKIRNSLLSDEQKQFVHRLLEYLQKLPSNFFKLKVDVSPHCPDKFVHLSVLPTNPSSIAFEMIFSVEPWNESVLHIGENSMIAVNTDLYGTDLKEWQNLFLELVKAVVEGKVSESIEYRGDRVCKVNLSAQLSETVFKFARDNIPEKLFNIFKNTKIQNIQYDSYRPRGLSVAADGKADS